jgi:diguanylate cyclase (GGDEF)-like protein
MISELLMRYRYTVWDFVILLVTSSLLIFLALEYELLSSNGINRTKVAQIEFGEALVVTLVLGIFVFVAFRRARAQGREVKLRTAAERRSRELAFLDPLTGLPNRRLFDDTVARAFAERPSADRTHAVFLLDLNRFKLINDVFGHPVGDEVLREVGRRLVAVLRESGDHAARLGGDEFGVVATHLLGPEQASGIALRIIDALAAPVLAGDTEHAIGAAIGIALFPRDGDTAEEVIRRADVALYRAKLEPHSSHHFFEADMDAHIRERSSMERELRRAIGAGDIQPHYQPIVDLKTNRIMGFQALARWRHSTLGDVPPERFIPVAESCGLIRQLSEQLLKTACRDACRWPAKTTLSFNVSTVQLRDKTFGLRVLSILAETGLSPFRLEIEITESALVRDLKSAQESLGSLRDAGVRIALDDFGTGYSSLYHLRAFKIDRIKIDRSFIETVDQKGDSAAIVRALMGLGHGLGIQITAEGIENQQQLDTLIDQGCDDGQGYLFSRALPAVEAEALFEPVGGVISKYA